MRKYIFFLSVILMGACQSPAVFEKYEEQPDEVWNRYHIVEFTADIPDSGQYIVKLCLRHTTDYEMANLWCFVSTRSHRIEQGRRMEEMAGVKDVGIKIEKVQTQG